MAETNHANPEMRNAWRIVEETGANLFLTGKAGTGKTTFLRQLRLRSAKRMVVLAPTGIAAINAGGVTVHSFFQLPLSPYLPGAAMSKEQRRYDRFSKEKLRLLRTLDLLVIDEISMVRADLLDAVDASLRRHRDPTLPFGGVQLLLIGDLQQLAPVVKPEEWEMLSEVYQTPYFFSSIALQQAGYETVELQHVYRQADEHFLSLLNHVRDNTADASVLAELNRRYRPGFNPPDDEGYIRLTTHNHSARAINTSQLMRLPGQHTSFHATVKGDFPESAFPAEPTLELKVGAQVMFLRNDPQKQYYNGLMGRVTALRADTIKVRPFGTEGEIDVEPAVWENARYTLNKQTGAIESDIQGTFTQYPLRLAWAVTIHKSQGLTFDKAIIDASASFAHGQTYVALSRCRTLEGIVLESPLSRQAIICDKDVADFTRSRSDATPDSTRLESLRESYTRACLDELFGMKRMRHSFNALNRIIQEHLSRLSPSLASAFSTRDAELARLEQVSRAFAVQYRTLPFGPALDERIVKGAGYYLEALLPFVASVKAVPKTVPNQTISTRLATALADFREILEVRRATLRVFETTQFTPLRFLQAKARATLSLESPSPAKATSTKRGTSRRKKSE